MDIPKEIKEAIDRVKNSDASGISHNEIYGKPVEQDLAIIARFFLSITQEYL